MHILADLALVDIKSGNDFNVSRLITIHIIVHQTDGVFRVFVLVIMDSLNQ